MKLTLASKISVLRTLLIIPFIILMLNVHDDAHGDIYRYLAFSTFIIMGLSDGLDGYLARSRNQITKLGAFLDPMGDKLMMVSALLLLSSQNSRIEGFSIPDWVVVLIIGRDVLLAVGFMIVYFITQQVRIVPVQIGKFSTVIQIAMVAGVLIGPELAHVFPAWIWVLRVLWWTAALAAILATLIYIRAGMRYIEEFDQHTPKRTG